MTENLTTKVCRMHYLMNMSKKEIAGKVGISRFRVSRIIQQAREDGIVTIHIRESHPTSSKIEEQLEQRFSLKYAVVVEPPEYSYDMIMRSIGTSAAEQLLNLLDNGDIFGMTWGATVNEVVKSLPQKVERKIEVVQITGGLEQVAIDVNAMDIVRRIAQIFDAPSHVLFAPAFVNTKAAHDALMANPGVRKTVEMFDQVNVAISGIGAFSVQLTSNLLMSGNLSKQDVEELREQHAVGDVFGHFYDKDGNICDTSLEERFMGIDIAQLRNVKYSIGVAGSKHKSRAILGALRGGLINILVTDNLTACEILKEDEAQTVYEMMDKKDLIDLSV